MLKQLFTKTNGLGQTGRIAAQRRFLATVQTNTPRRTPENRPRATPVTYERATFTIKVRKTEYNYQLPTLMAIRVEKHMTESLSEQKGTSPARPSSQPPSWAIPSQ